MILLPPLTLKSLPAEQNPEPMNTAYDTIEESLTGPEIGSPLRAAPE